MPTPSANPADSIPGFPKNRVILTLAAASAVVTTVLFVVDAKRPKVTVHALRFAPTLDQHGAGFAAAWSF